MPHSLSACMLSQLLQLYSMDTEHFHIENTLTDTKNNELPFQTTSLLVVRTAHNIRRSIHGTETGGDWYIYPQFLAYENPRNTHKNAQKSSKNIKSSIES